MSARADELAAELQAHSDARIAKWREDRAKAEAAEMDRETPQLDATPELVRRALEDGGRAVVTVRARESGRHVCIRLTAKKRGRGGRFVSRARKEGRVGLAEAEAVFADDVDLEFPESAVGRFNLRTGEWEGSHPGTARRWAAEKTLAWALGAFPQMTRLAEVFLAAECSYCGHQLRDPESIERGIGPECFGRHTASRAAERTDG